MLKILYLDDSQTSLELASMSLKDRPCDMVFVDNGAEAIAELERRPPEIVISDLNMPKMNGWQFLDRAKEMCPRAFRVLISITKTYDYLLREMPRRNTSFDLFLEKPYTKQGWNDALDRIVDQLDSRFIHQVIYRQEIGATCLDLLGNIDSPQEAGFKRAIDHYMGKDGAPRMIIDLQKVASLGQAGVRILTQAAAEARERGGKIALVSPQKTVKILLKLSGPAPAFQVYSTPEEARRSFKPRNRDPKGTPKR